MADDMRANRPDMMSDSGMGRMNNGGMNSKMPWIILIVVVVILVILGVLFRDKLFGGNKSGDNSGYEAVFLTNGQVYFGKLSHSGHQYATLTDIYYLQVTTPPGLQGSQNQASAAQQQAQQQLSLVKLGQELHGPVDSMEINRDQILFYEDMKESGKVMQAIRQYQKNPPANNANTGAAPANTAAPTTPANGQ